MGDTNGDFLDSTLLLNSSYEPLRVIPWQKAVTLFFLGKVEVVENYEHCVRSIRLTIKMPAVVRLLKFVKLHTRRPPLYKMNLLLRDSYTCQYCLKKLSKEDATIDHVIPKSKGGKTSWDNVVIACGVCNRKKGGRTPAEAKMNLNSIPVAPNWLPVINVTLNSDVPLKWKIFLVI